MSKKIPILTEIVRVRNDNGTLYVRLPRFWAKAHLIEHSSYLVAKSGPDGTLVLKPWEDEVRAKKKARKH